MHYGKNVRPVAICLRFCNLSVNSFATAKLHHSKVRYHATYDYFILLHRTVVVNITLFVWVYLTG